MNSYIDINYIRENTLDTNLLSLTDSELSFYLRFSFNFIEDYFITHTFQYPKKNANQETTFPRLNEDIVNVNVKKAQMYLTSYFYENKDNLNNKTELILYKHSLGDMSKEYQVVNKRNIIDNLSNAITLLSIYDLKGFNLC